MHRTLKPKIKSSPPTQTFSNCFTNFCTKHWRKMNSISSWFVGVALMMVGNIEAPASALPKASLFEVLQTTTAKSKVGVMWLIANKGSILLIYLFVLHMKVITWRYTDFIEDSDANHDKARTQLMPDQVNYELLSKFPICEWYLTITVSTRTGHRVATLWPSASLGHRRRGCRTKHEEWEEVLALGRQRRRAHHVRGVGVGHPSETVGTQLDHRDGWAGLFPHTQDVGTEPTYRHLFKSIVTATGWPIWSTERAIGHLAGLFWPKSFVSFGCSQGILVSLSVDLYRLKTVADLDLGCSSILPGSYYCQNC